jgi:hypothetical protein
VLETPTDPLTTIRLQERTMAASKSSKPFAVGMKFHALTVVGLAEKKSKNGLRYWECACDCGKTTTAMKQDLLNGHKKSCGHLNKRPVTTHWRTWRIWRFMMQRCHDPKKDNYYRYGGAGIRVCQRWHMYDNFLADMGAAPDGLTLDRVDGARGYDPSNCRWATKETQNKNRTFLPKRREIAFGQWLWPMRQYYTLG